MEEAIARKSIFKRFAEYFKSLFKPDKKVETVEYSRFKHYLDGYDEQSEDYNSIKLAVDICDEAFLITEKRIMLIDKQKAIEERLNEHECYSKLDDDDVYKIKDLLNRFASLTRDRKNLRDQLDSFERSLSFMRELEPEVPDALKEIKEAEERQRLFKQDLGYLEGEKSDLEYEMERFEIGLSFIQKFTVGMCIFFGLATIVLAFLSVFNNIDVLFPMTALIVMVIIISVLLYAFRRRIIFEKALNYKKQNRAVELINKKTVLYAHYTNFLNYEYKKFKVKNSEMLKNNMSDYGLYKHLTARLDSIRSIMYQTEAEIEDFLREKDLYNPSFTIERFSQVFDMDNKKSVYNELISEKSAIETNLSLMDKRHEALWDILSDLSEKDTTEEGIVGRIIKSYVDEAGNLISRNTPLEENTA